MPGSAQAPWFVRQYCEITSRYHTGDLSLEFDQRARDIAAGKRFIGPERLKPTLIYAAMQASARDLKRRSVPGDASSNGIERGNNFDFDSGFGLLDAEQALRAIRGF